MKNKSPMLMQIESVPGLMREMEYQLEEEAQRILSSTDIRKFDHIVITGCGDSYCSALAAKFTFLKYTDSLVEVESAIDLSRYHKDKRMAMQNTVFVIVSNSGRVKRLIELCKRIKQLGGFVLVVTGNAESALAHSGDLVLQMRIPGFAYAPGIRSYCGCLCALYHLAFAVGTAQESSRKKVIDKVKLEMNRLILESQSFMPKWEEDVRLQKQLFKDTRCVELVGSGSNYATAFFGSAKIFETVGWPALINNTEDWFHMNFFLKDIEHTPIVLFCNKADGDWSRGRELLAAAKEMGRRVLCITDDMSLECAYKIQTPYTPYAELHGLLQYLPVSMLFSALCDELGEEYFRGGKGRWSGCQDCATLINSEEKILMIPEENE